MNFKNRFLIDYSSNRITCSIENSSLNSIQSAETTKIAIIDSGVDEEKARVKIEKRFSEVDNTKDDFGHGTAVASIIASKKSKTDNIEGIYPKAIIFDVNVLDENGYAKIDDIIEAIEWSINQNVDVINMSFGVEKNDERLHKVIKKAVEDGIIIVASAGNTLGMYTEYPAKYKEVLSISGVDKDMNIYKYAAKGKVDFVAPGVDVQAVKIGKLSKQERLSGTSFSTAYATGVIATLLSEEKINKDNYREVLLDYAELPEGETCNSTYGCGVLQLR